AWAQREAALGRLLRHPSSGASTIAACAGFAADPAHQVFAEPLSDLHVSDHPDAVRLMLAQVGNPSSNRALYGALVAAIRRVDRHRLAPDDLAALLRAVREALHPGVPDEIRHLLPVLLRRLPATVSGPVVGELRRVAAADPVGRLVLGSGRTEATGAAGVVVTRVAAGATGRLSRELPGPDGVLLALLDELLFSPDPGDRLHAGFLIAATPYRETVAAALTGELRGALRGDGTHAVALLAALGARRRPVVAGPAGVPAGERGGLTSPPRSPRPPLLLPPVRHVQHDPAMGTGTGQYEHPEGQGRPDTHRERRRALEAAAEDHVAQCLVAEHVDHVLAGNGRVRTDRCPQVHAEQRPTGRVRRQRQTLPLGVHLAVLHVVAG